MLSEYGRVVKDCVESRKDGKKKGPQSAIILKPIHRD
jgi:hypothetical protein